MARLSDLPFKPELVVVSTPAPTVPEVIVAVHAGLRVLGLSVITDMCLPDHLEVATVENILAVARSAEPKLRAIITAAVRDAG